MREAILTCVVALAATGFPAECNAQTCASCGPTASACGVSGCFSSCGQEYRLRCQTYFEEQQVTAYRLQCETVYEDRQVTSYRPVWETEMRERRYSVARPVYETAEREERYTVQKPVYETHVEDRSYNVTRNVMETQEREERYMVARQVWETSEREERFVVRRQVVECGEREECSTVMEAVTTYRPVQVDQGTFVEQAVCQPGEVRRRLGYAQDGLTIDPQSGQPVYQRGGLSWTPQAGPSQMVVQRVWQPNIVCMQVPETQYVPRQVTRRVPVKTERNVDEAQVRPVPMHDCRIEN